jgi:hypothetical protein
MTNTSYARPPLLFTVFITPHCTRHQPPANSTTPYHLRRDVVACLLNLAVGHRGNQKFVLSHASEDEGPGKEGEGMAQRLFGRVLRSCGDYFMQVGWVGRRWTAWLGAPAFVSPL